MLEIIPHGSAQEDVRFVDCDVGEAKLLMYKYVFNLINKTDFLVQCFLSIFLS